MCKLIKLAELRELCKVFELVKFRVHLHDVNYGLWLKLEYNIALSNSEKDELLVLSRNFKLGK